ncbi:hypothetical protein HanLR1_Chr03g0079361 [Helianthus annuus]|nr:hypothetical protein HanHA89_Chr03g0085821 [Helianthus annuus]KAJ0766597.1 hypothetical protein HanLR1_Chr03g0079361 [Helianthus annuus]
MKFPLQCFSKIITGTTGLLTASDSGQDGVGGRDRYQPVTPRFPCVSPVGPVGDYRDVVGNIIVKPHNIIECTAEA